MIIKKTHIALATTMLFASTKLYALSSNIDFEKVGMEAIAKEFAAQTAEADYQQYPLLSGDGKTIYFYRADIDGGELDAGRILYGTNFSEKVIVDADNDTGISFITKDGKFVYNHGVALKRDGTRYWNDNFIVLGLTGSGLFFGGETDGREALTLELRDPSNIDQIIKAIPNTYNIMDGSLISLSHDGSVATYMNRDTNTFDVIYGEKWEKHKKLIKFDEKINSKGISFPLGGAGLVVSPKGDILMLSAPEGKIYTGANFDKETILPKKLGKETNENRLVHLAASSEDADLIVGTISDKLGDENTGNPYLPVKYSRPVIWYGENWSELKDLGTLGGKETDIGTATSVSYNGELVAGMSTDEDGKFTLTLWRLIKKNNEPSIAIVSPEKIGKKVDKLASDTFRIFEYQRHGLLNLLNGCHVENTQGHYCISAHSSMSGQSSARDVKAGFSTAYSLTDDLFIGGVLEHSVYNRLKHNYDNARNNIGLGLYTQWRYKTDNGEFYVRPALSFNQYRANFIHQATNGTEYSEGKTKIKGLMLSLTLGQKYQYQQNELGWYLGVRSGKIKQSSFTDSSEGFPMNYGKLSYKNTTLFAGADLTHHLNEKVDLVTALEIEQRIYQNRPQFKAYNQYIGQISVDSPNLSKTSLKVMTGIKYKVTPDVNFQLMPSIIKANTSPIYWNIGLNLTAQF